MEHEMGKAPDSWVGEGEEFEARGGWDMDVESTLEARIQGDVTELVVEIEEMPYGKKKRLRKGKNRQGARNQGPKGGGTTTCTFNKFTAETEEKNVSLPNPKAEVFVPRRFGCIGSCGQVGGVVGRKHLPELERLFLRR